MSSIWRNFLGLFRKDPLYETALEECHGTADHLGLLLNVSLSELGRQPPPPRPLDLRAAEQGLAVFEKETRRKVLTHITASGPGHLVSGLVLLTAVIDLEKLAENVRQVRGVATGHPGAISFGEIDDAMTEIEQRTLTLFREMRQAFTGDDVELSRDVIARYRGGLSGACDAVAGRLLAGDVGGMSPADAAAASVYVINLKRIGMHSRNLITNIANPYQRIGSPEASAPNR